MATADDLGTERRRFHRILFDAPATLVGDGRRLRTGVLDISLNGALLRRPRGWNEALTDALLEIGLGDGNLIRMEVELVHQEDDRIGFQCRRIDMESVTLLRRLIELNLADPALLERELQALG